MPGSFGVGNYVHVTKRNTNGTFLVNAFGNITRWKYGKSGNVLYQVHFDRGDFKKNDEYFYASRLELANPNDTTYLDEFAPQSKVEEVPAPKNDEVSKALKNLILALDVAVEAEHSYMKSETEANAKAREAADARLRKELERARELAST